MYYHANHGVIIGGIDFSGLKVTVGAPLLALIVFARQSSASSSLAVFHHQSAKQGQEMAEEPVEEEPAA